VSSSGSYQTPEPVRVDALAETGGSWSQAVAYRDLVAVSGQIALDPQGNVVGQGSLVEQAEYVFGCIDAALSAADSGRERLIKITMYVTTLDGLTELRAARDRWLGPARPASTLVQVAGLVHEGLLIEVDALAARRASG
jgi:enamine deaminase RidA (YjgF/YER057c/UK114 family)